MGPCAENGASQRLRSVRQFIAQARVLGWRARLRYAAPTPPRWRPRWRTPRRGRTHSYSSAAGCSPAGRAARLWAIHRVQASAGLPLRRQAASMVRWRTASG
jgi:hypothetical protein